MKHASLRDKEGEEEDKENKNLESVTSRDVAAFEAGIKLGALYHQFIGTPINMETVDIIERMIERSVCLQPFVKDASVRIDRDKLRERVNLFGYCELQGDMIDVHISVSYDNVEAHASLQYDESKDYPLMLLRKIVVKQNSPLASSNSKFKNSKDAINQTADAEEAEEAKEIE